MPSYPPKKNAAFTISLPILDADGDLVSGGTALSGTVAGADGVAVLGVFGATAIPTDEGEGFYDIALTAAQMNFDRVAGVLKTTTAGAKNTPFTIYTSVRQTDDLAFPATSGRSMVVDAAGLVDSTTVKVGPTGVGTAQTAGDIMADTNDIQTRLPAALVAGRIDASVGAMAADVVTAAAVANGAIDALTFAAGAIDNAAFNVTETLTANPAAGGIVAASFGAGAIDAAAIAADAIGTAELSAAAANKIADSTLRRTYANARASADGDAVNFRSLLGAIGKLVNKWSISGTTLTVFQEDDITSTAPGGTQALTTDAAANPIVTIDTT